MPERVRHLMDRIADAAAAAPVDQPSALLAQLKRVLDSSTIVATFDLDPRQEDWLAVVVTAHGWIVVVTASEVWANPRGPENGPRGCAGGARRAVLRRNLRPA